MSVDDFDEWNDSIFSQDVVDRVTDFLADKIKRDEENKLDRDKVLDVMDKMFEGGDSMVLGPPPVDEVVHKEKKEVKNPNFPNLADQLEAFINSVDCGAVNVDNRYSDLVLRGFMRAALADLPQEWCVVNGGRHIIRGKESDLEGKHYQLIGEIKRQVTYTKEGYV